MNKGSKYWQENWEYHIDELEQEFSGDLYKVIRDTNKDDFCCCPLSTKAYAYSVSKITMITSIALLGISCMMFLFYLGMIVIRCIKKMQIDFNYFESMRWGFGIVILLGIFLLSFCIFESAKGSQKKESKPIWTNRSAK